MTNLLPPGGKRSIAQLIADGEFALNDGDWYAAYTLANQALAEDPNSEKAQELKAKAEAKGNTFAKSIPGLSQLGGVIREMRQTDGENTYPNDGLSPHHSPPQ